MNPKLNYEFIKTTLEWELSFIRTVLKYGLGMKFTKGSMYRLRITSRGGGHSS